jgi:hypothetical protein
MIPMIPMIPMILALRRVMSAPGFIAVVWLFHVAIAAAIGVFVHATIDQAIAPHEIADDGRRLFALLDVLTDHRGIVAGFSAAALAGAIASACAWTLLSGLLVVRLSGERDPGAIASRWVSTLPAVVVQSIWHLVLRGLLVFAVLTAAGSLPRMLSWPLLVLAWSVSIVALDAARASVVLTDARPFHPRTAAAALLAVVRTPRRFAGAVLLAALQLVVLVSAPYVAVAWLGAPIVPTVVRGLALVAAVLGLWRLCTVVLQTRPPGSDPTPP